MIIKNHLDILDKFGRECLVIDCNDPPADGRLYCDKHKSDEEKPKKSRSLCSGCVHYGKDPCWYYEDAEIIKRKIRHYRLPFVYRVIWVLDCFKIKNYEEINAK